MPNLIVHIYTKPEADMTSASGQIIVLLSSQNAIGNAYIFINDHFSAVRLYRNIICS